MMYKKPVTSQAYCNRPTVSQRFDKTWSRAEVPEISVGTQILCSVFPMSTSLPSLISPWGWKNPCDRHQVVATDMSAQPMNHSTLRVPTFQRCCVQGVFPV